MSTDYITKEELEFIKEAHKCLENQSFIMKATDLIGKPLAYIQKNLPDKAKEGLESIVKKSLTSSLKVALKSVSESSDKSFSESVKGSQKSRLIHTAATAVSGALGGFFGEPGLLVELPITTSLMMRNIVDVGTEFGFDKNDPSFALECLYVFTLGSDKSKDDDHHDSAYFTSRSALQAVINQGAEFIAANSAKVVLENVSKGTAPMILQFINRVAVYFEIVVTEKMLAEAIPVVGSVGGASINVAFTNHFSQAAKYHFGLKALEKKYGYDLVLEKYESISAKNISAA